MEAVSEPPNSKKNVIPTSYVIPTKDEQSEEDGRNLFKNQRNSRLLISEKKKGIPTIRFANVGMTILAGFETASLCVRPLFIPNLQGEPKVRPYISAFSTTPKNQFLF